MPRIKTNFALAAETVWELKRLTKQWGLSQGQTLEQIIHYAGAICTKSVDATIKDAAIRRQAEAKIESRDRAV